MDFYEARFHIGFTSAEKSDLWRLPQRSLTHAYPAARYACTMNSAVPDRYSGTGNT